MSCSQIGLFYRYSCCWQGIYDLLAKPPGISGKIVTLLEDFQGHQEIRGANKIKCHTAREALAFFFEGEKHRCNAPHILNEVRSSFVMMHSSKVIQLRREATFRR